MAKRRAEDVVCLHPASKRPCGRSLRPADAQPGRGSPAGAALASGSRSRKRSLRVEVSEAVSEEASLGPKVERTSGWSDGCSTVDAPHSSSVAPQVCRPADAGGLRTSSREEDHTTAEDCKYNWFQFWRSPLPALDPSLLEDISEQLREEDKSSVRDFSDVMET